MELLLTSIFYNHATTSNFKQTNDEVDDLNGKLKLTPYCVLDITLIYKW